MKLKMSVSIGGKGKLFQILFLLSGKLKSEIQVTWTIYYKITTFFKESNFKG